MFVCLFFGYKNANAQTLASYTFASASGTYTPITGGTVISSAGCCDDDTNYPLMTIGFAFTFGATAHSNMVVSPNGFVLFPNNDYVLGFNADLLQRAIPTIGTVRVQLTGVSPNQVCVIQYENWGRFGSTRTGEIYNFQIRLTQTTNTVAVVYGAMTTTIPDTKSVGLTNGANTDFNTRGVTTDWATSTAGTGGFAASATTSPTVFPANGLTYTWTRSLPCTAVTITPATSAISSTINVPITNITLSASGGVAGATYVYSIIGGALPVGVTLSSAGVISGTPTASGTGIFAIMATSTPNVCVNAVVYTFTVACVGIAINPATLANGVIGTAYTQTATQTGLTGTPVWSVTGTLPNGLSIASATGIISGTPTTNGTFPFAVNVTDGTCFQTRNYSVVIGCSAIVFGVTTATNAVVGIAYTLNAGATGNTSALTYSVSPALPAGLSLNTATGAITGTPTAITASATYVVTATQTVTCFATQSYTFGVIPNCTPIVLGLASIPNATIGTPYSQTFTATGGATGATYTFTTTTPQLSVLAGTSLTLSAAGVLSGTPTFSTSITFRVTATTTPNSCTGFKDYTFVINPNPATSVDNSLANLVKVSPNPSSGDFSVDFGTINMAKSSVSVYDAQGKVVFTSENNSNLMTVSLDKFANGIYLLEVKTLTGRITKRLSKTN